MLGAEYVCVYIPHLSRGMLKFSSGNVCVHTFAYARRLFVFLYSAQLRQGHHMIIRTAMLEEASGGVSRMFSHHLPKRDYDDQTRDGRRVFPRAIND